MINNATFEEIGQTRGSSAAAIQFSFRNRANFHSRFLCYQCVFDFVPLSTLSPFFVCFRLHVQLNLLETKGNIPWRLKSVSLLRHLSFSKAWSNLLNASKQLFQSAVDEISMLKRKIEQSETSTVKLQAHTEKVTYLSDLRYVAKANITPDEEFKIEIHSIRRETERKLIQW